VCRLWCHPVIWVKLIVTKINRSNIDIHTVCQRQHFFSCAVDGGHRAVIFDRFRGVQEEVVGEGTHFLIPWVQKPIIFDVRARPRNVPVITGSKGWYMLIRHYAIRKEAWYAGKVVSICPVIFNVSVKPFSWQWLSTAFDACICWCHMSADFVWNELFSQEHVKDFQNVWLFKGFMSKLTKWPLQKFQTTLVFFCFFLSLEANIHYSHAMLQICRMWTSHWESCSDHRFQCYLKSTQIWVPTMTNVSCPPSQMKFSRQLW
jgi:hypothetical protein